MVRETGLIVEMEREVEEAGLGGWFNGNLEEVPDVRVCASSQINPGRLSNQFRTSADRCTPTLPR